MERALEAGVLPRPEADRAALIGRLRQRADCEWMAELLIDLARFRDEGLIDSAIERVTCENR